jgi:hypothetical protein
MIDLKMLMTRDTSKIQGVSEFHRQTFRANSTIKNKHKTLNTYEAKNAFNKKRKNNYDLNRLLWLLIQLFSRLSRKLSVFDPICIKSFMLIFDHRISPESLSVEFWYTLYIGE